jgi:hypothetical protein
MEICESTHHEKPLISENQKTRSSEYSGKIKENESSNQVNDSNSQTQKDNDQKNAVTQRTEGNKCPKLDIYDRSIFISGMKSEYSHFNNKTASVFSNGKTEEEVIIKGEINKDCKNKEEDFDNNSFKNLIKNNGGIVLKNDDMSSYACSSSGMKSYFNIGSEAISEIKSKHTFPAGHIRNKGFTYDLRDSHRSINLNLIKNNMSENNKTNLTYNKTKLRDSNKINLTFNDNYPQIDSFLNVPKIDEPLPDIDELSTESPLPIGRNSIVST